MSEQIEFWERDGKGNILPQEVKAVRNTLNYDATISKYKKELSKSSSEDRKKVLEGTIKKLEELKKEDSEEIMIQMIPLLNYEIKNIRKPEISGKDIGCDGLPVIDQTADILSKHCLKPKHSYQEWIETKDESLKIIIVNKIIDSSIPSGDKKKKMREKMKKILQEGVQKMEEIKKI